VSKITSLNMVSAVLDGVTVLIVIVEVPVCPAPRLPTADGLALMLKSAAPAM